MSIAAETSRAILAETSLGNQITLNAAIVANYHTGAAADAMAASSGILTSQQTNISQNTMTIASLQSVSSLQSAAITINTSNITSLIASQAINAANIVAESNRAINVELSLAQLIATTRAASNPAISLSTAITSETTRATAAEISNASAITGESTRAIAAESTLTTNVGALQTAVHTLQQSSQSLANVPSAAVPTNKVVLDGGWGASQNVFGSYVAANITVTLNVNIVTVRLSAFAFTAINDRGSANVSTSFAIYSRMFPSWAYPSERTAFVILLMNGDTAYPSVPVLCPFEFVIGTDGYVMIGALGATTPFSHYACIQNSMCFSYSI